MLMRSLLNLLLFVSLSSLGAAQAVITSLSPSTVLAGLGPLTLTLNGTGFTIFNSVQWNGAAQPTTLISSTQVQATIPANLTAVAGTASVRVRLSPLTSATSNTVNFTVQPQPLPTVTTYSPVSLSAGSNNVLMAIGGTGFNAATSVTLADVPLTITSVSATLINATIPAALRSVGAVHVLKVINPAPGGGIVSPGAVTVQNPVPQITSAVIASVSVNAGPVTRTVNGTGFNASSVVRIDGVPVSSTLNGTNQLEFTVSGPQTLVAANLIVDVVNPAPGGGTSNPKTLSILNPNPGLASISPSSMPTLSPNATILVTGSFYNSSSVIRVDGLAIPTSNIGSTQLQGVIPSSAMQSPGLRVIDVRNPPPGGGISATANFTVVTLPPIITSVTPNIATVGSGPVSITVSGSNFDLTSSIQVIGQGFVSSNFINTTLISATIPSSMLQSAGNLAIQVVTGSIGQGSSTLNFLRFNSATPTVTNVLSPGTPPIAGVAGALAINLATVGAHEFTQLLFDGVPLPASFGGSLQGVQTMNFTVPSGTVTSAGVHTVQLVNPGNGGGAGPQFPITWNNPFPNLTAITPQTIGSFGAPVTITAHGSNFNDQSVITVNGIALPTTYLPGASQLTAVLTEEFQFSTGRPIFGVHNPPPGGGVDTDQNVFVFGPRITSVSPGIVPVMNAGSPPVVLLLSGNFDLPSVTHVRINGVAIPHTWLSPASISVPIGPFIPQTLAPGGFAITVTTTPNLPGVRPSCSNAVGVTVGTASSPDNAGTISLVPRIPDPGLPFVARIECPAENVPVTVVVDLTQNFLAPFSPGGSFDVLLGTLFGQPVPLADGIGLFGAPTGAILRPNDLGPEGVPSPRGIFDIYGLVAPPQFLGVFFNLQAFYLDPTKPGGLNVTHVNRQAL